MESNNERSAEPKGQTEAATLDTEDESSISPEEEAREMAAVSEEISKRRRRRMFIAIFMLLTITWLLGQLGDPFVPQQ